MKSGVESEQGGGRIFTMGPGQPPPETPHSRQAVKRAGEEAMRRFFLTFGGGTAAILLMKVLVGSGWLAAVSAAGIIVWYSWGIYSRPAVSRGTDVIDSVYYLGFLFTLVSLCSSLITTGLAGAGLLDTGSIVTDFGIAITSTMAGMLCRIGLTIRRDGSAEGVEDEVRASLNEAAMQLQAQFRYAVLDFEEFRERLRSNYKEHATSIGKFAAAMEKSTRAAQERAEQIGTMVAEGFDVRTEIEETIRVFIAELKKTYASVEKRTGLIRETGERLQVFVDAARSAGQKWEEEAGQIEAMTFSAAKVMEAAVERIRKVDLAAEIRRTLDAGDAWKTAGTRGREEIEELRRLAGGMAVTLEEIRKSNAALVEQARRAGSDRRNEPVSDFQGGFSRSSSREAEQSGRATGGRILFQDDLSRDDAWYWKLAFRGTLILATLALLVYLAGSSRGWWNRSAEAGAVIGGAGSGTSLQTPEAQRAPRPEAALQDPLGPRPSGTVPDWYRQRFPEDPADP